MRTKTTIFISHSSHDDAVAGDVRAHLEARGFPTTFLDYHPNHGIRAGKNWERELYLQLKRCGAVIYLGSVESEGSKWCFAELALARSMAKPIFPLRIDKEAKQPLVNDTQWIDLTAAKEKGYESLLLGLKDYGLDPAAAFAWDYRRAPFPGLSAFEEYDAAVFFGREKETDDLYVGKMIWTTDAFC